jgi:hypothetical protein
LFSAGVQGTQLPTVPARDDILSGGSIPVECYFLGRKRTKGRYPVTGPNIPKIQENGANPLGRFIAIDFAFLHIAYEQGFG